MEVHYCVPVWGDRYITLLTNVSMPSLLAAGNLPALGEFCQLRVRIFTRSADAGLIRSSAIWPIFSRRIRTDIVPCDHLDLSHTYMGMSNLLGEAIRQAGAAGAAFIPQAADSFWSDGSFATVGRLLGAGKQLILCGGVRVTAETFIPAVRAKHLAADGGLPVPAPELVDMAIAHLHPSMGVYFTDGRLKPQAPVQSLLPAGGRSFVQTIIHAVPLVVAAAAGHDGRLSATIDRGFIETLGIPETKVAMISSSDDLTLLDIAAARRLLGDATADPASLPALTGRWLHQENEPHALYGGRFYARAVRFRGGDAERPGMARAMAITARRARRAVCDGLIVAEMLAAAQALRDRGWKDLARVLTMRAMSGPAIFSTPRLRPYTAYLPAAARQLAQALDRPATMIYSGLRDAALPHGAGVAGRFADGPISTGLGRLYVMAAEE